MRVRLRKLGTGSVFLLSLVIWATAGLIVGGLVAAASSVPLPANYELTFLDRLGPWALAAFPLVYGVLGGIFAALAAVIYNMAAAVTGGVRVEIPELDGGRRPSQPEAAGAAGASSAAGVSSAASGSEEPSPSPDAGEPSSRRSSGE